MSKNDRSTPDLFPNEPPTPQPRPRKPPAPAPAKNPERPLMNVAIRPTLTTPGSGKNISYTAAQIDAQFRAACDKDRSST